LEAAAQINFTRSVCEVTRIDKMRSKDIRRFLAVLNIVEEIESNQTSRICDQEGAYFISTSSFI
jgi:hypothetical protein